MNAQDLCGLFDIWARIMQEKKDWLIELDSVAGDSDLGLTMSDGFAAAAEAVRETAPCGDVGKTLYQAGKRMASAVPSTMGTLMASGLMNAGKTLKRVEYISDREEAQLFEAYFDGVMNRGKAQLGDKTFLDGLYPAVEVLQKAAAEGKDFHQAADDAAKAARAAFEGTRGMLARQGRMAIRGEASRELLDPGAAVAALLMEGYAEFKKTRE